MRHLDDVFALLGLESDKVNRARVDAAIRTAFDIDAEAHCPEVWAAIKPLSATEIAAKTGAVLDAQRGA